MAQVLPITRHTSSTAEKNYEVNYFKCRNGIFDLDLNIYEQMTLIYLTSLQNTPTIYASHATIAKKCKMSLTTTKETIKALETKGYILVKHQAAIGKTNNYRISRKCKEKIRQVEAKTLPQPALPLAATDLPPSRETTTTPSREAATIITSIYNNKIKDGDVGKRPNDTTKSMTDLNERRKLLNEQAKLFLEQEQKDKNNDKDSGLKQND